MPVARNGTPLTGLGARLRALVQPRRCGPIGLDIAADKLHMVQFEHAPGTPLIRAAISVPYTGSRDALLADKKQLKLLIKNALSNRPFMGRQVVSCLPASEVNIVTLSYQRTAGEDDAAAIIRELRGRLKDELDRSIVDYIAIRSDAVDTADRSAIVATAPRDRVCAYLDVLRHCGLEPLALDIGPAALARLISALDIEGRHTNSILVNFGRHRSYISVIWGRRLILDRDLDFGEAKLVDRLAKVLDMPEESVLRLLYERGLSGATGPSPDAVAQTIGQVLRPEFANFAAEVNKSLIYTASKTRGQSVERIYLLGSVARYPGVTQWIQGLVSVPVEVANAFNVFTVQGDAASQEELEPVAGIALASGLALRGSSPNG